MASTMPTLPTLTKEQAAAAIAKATAAMEEPANAAAVKTAVDAAAGNMMLLMSTVGPVVAGIMKATLTENGFSADQMGVMAFLGALRPHMTDPTLAASASALALKFIPAPMVAMFLPGATAPPAASAGAPPAAPAPAP